MKPLRQSRRRMLQLGCMFSSVVLGGVSPVPIFAEKPVSFSIAIHGGAGADPSKWNAEQIEIRLQGLRKALKTGVEILEKGGKAIDAVEATVRVLEDDPHFNAGRGAVLNADGEHELDASIMDGTNLACGAVASVRQVKNPISLARRVMTDTPHVLLTGPRADGLAKELKLQLESPEYFRTPEQIESWKKWLEREKTKKGDTSYMHNVDDPLFYLGTVGCVARDSEGHLAAGTSTGGLLAKRWGRIGDSPIIGAGTIADDRSCAVSCTGIGELFIQNSVAHDISARMRYGKQDLAEAVDEIIDHVLPVDSGGLIAIDREGKIHLRFNTPGMARGAADSNGRFEVALGKD